MFRRIVFVALLVPGVLVAQTQKEYASRREALLRKVGDGVIVAFGAHAPAQDYLPFDQTPSFRYLTGLREPDAALVMVKKGGTVAATMFVQPQMSAREVWTGARIGTRGVESLTGIRGRASDQLPTVLDSLAGTGQQFLVVGDLAAHEAEAQGQTAVRSANDQLLDRIKERYTALRITPVNDVVDQLRGTKSPAELSLIKQAVEITVLAQKEAIAALTDGLNEFEIQALIEYTFRRNGADRPAFATIVGSGPNSTTLHYNRADRFIGINDMVVMDIGASYKGYAADVTRTVPASGHFSTSQRDIYQLVRDVQGAAERQAVTGAPSRLMNDSANAVMAAGLARLKLIDSPTATYDCSTGPTPRQCPQFRLYYMHGLGHGIGLEVHDPEQFYYTARLAPGSAFTIEPGVYVREHVLEEMPDTPRNREIATRLRPFVNFYKNIGVRIEDDYAVTDRGIERLSAGAPREILELEALMKEGAAGPAKRNRAMVERYREQP